MKTKIVLLITLLSALGGYSQKKWTLKECVNYALENNITIKQNKLNVKLAEKDVDIAKGNFLPDLNGSSRGNFSSGLSQDRNGILQNTQNFNSSFSLSSGGTIFNGFRNINSKKQAVLGVKGNELDLAKIENDISLNVVNTYLNVLFAKENLAVAVVQAEISKKQIARAKAQFDAGAIPKGDLLNVQSTASNDAQNIVLQENTLNLALLRLAQLLQISSDNFDVEKINIDSPSLSLLYNSSNAVYQKALTNRPEIERAKLNVENSLISLQLAKGAYLPTLTYSLGVSSSFFHQFNNLIRPNDYFLRQINDRISYSAGLSLNIPIFNRFQTKNRVAKSVINKEISEIALESQKLQLQQEIEKSYLDAKAAAKTYEAANISLEAQNEAFKNAQVSYDYGSMTQFDFDQVRNRLVNAEGAMIRAKYDYVFKTKVLKFYFGESILD
ncbi:TolC family protein [Tenacibaculum halocynthiae]|uniref:TolC family protein n=1 Tax=Tenacibaculum halocynthiae TaxID=1254437 RepID=UPI003D6484B9